MKKRLMLIVSAILLTISSLYIAYALNNPTTSILNVITKGEKTHGNYQLDIRETRLAAAESGYLGVVNYETEPGYYVKDFKVTFNDTPLELGFEAGSETGNFFRKYEFSPLRDEFQFIIPTEASESNKINIEIEFAKKTAFDIYYKKYNSNSYTEDDIYNIDNYGEDKLLVEGYRDGDLVLPDEVTSNGSVLKFQFANSNDYNEYKNTKQEEPDREWFASEAVVDNNNYLTGNPDSCIDEEKACYIVVDKDFKDISFGRIRFGYTNLNIYTTDYIGFSVETDINNFNDILSETGGSSIGFTENKLETSIEIFYGTRKLKLKKTQVKDIINDNLENNCGTVRDFDNVTGNGYGYEASYKDGVATITINTYYQDELTLELNLLKNNKNILNNKVEINLRRFAFAGNAGQLLEVDELGRNCRENNNGNTCDKGIYYSTQYRGVLNFMYIKENEEEKHFNDIYRVTEITNDSITLDESAEESGYKRDKDFNPHAIALFYDENDMIIETRDFDLNESIPSEGFVKKDVFKEVFKKYNINRTIDKDFILFDHDHQTTINNVEYFGNHPEDAIMHDIVIISKKEAQEKGIKKIGLFLVNGEIEEGSIPALTYGIGEGRIMQIFGGDE